MTEHKVSSRYASSFLESIIQKKMLDVVSDDVELISITFEKNSNLNRVIKNPIIKAELKSSILKEIFKGKISSETMDFIGFVIKKKREEILLSILEKFKELRDEKLGFINVNVSTAAEFSETQKSEFQSKLQDLLKKKVRVYYKIDEKLLGGFIAQAGDTVYNASIKHQLDLLKKHFIHADPISN